MHKKIVFLLLALLSCLPLLAQRQSLKNIPYIDQRRLHYGFLLGLDMSDVTFSHSGANAWAAECPSVNPSFCVGLMGDVALTENLNVRCTPMLHFMSVPEDVFEDATVYLRIYFFGLSGLLIYNMGSGILRAVGDTTRPLVFLIITSILNTLLDLLFVIVFHMGIAGVAYATILAQAVSAVLTLILLTRSHDIYRLSWRDLKVDGGLLKRIFSLGLPAGIQSVITAFSNVFVQSYINFFGSACMAGWSCYNKLDSFIMLPLQSMAMAATTFVSQNIGAKQIDRADKGTRTTILMSVTITGVIALFIYIFAGPAIGLFSKDEAVIDFGILFIRANTFFLLFNCVNHVLAGALRGRGDSRGPMIIMISTFVAVRQVYLFIMAHYISNTPRLIGFGYPVGWMACCVLEVSYYYLVHVRKHKAA